MLCAALFFNLFLLYEMNKPAEYEATFAETRQLYTAMQEMTNAEKLIYLNDQEKICDAIQQKEQYENAAIENPAIYHAFREAYDAAYPPYETQPDGSHDYAANQRKITLIQKTKSELETVMNQKNNLLRIQKNAEQLLLAPIFSETMDGFSRKNIEKTAGDFLALQNIEIQYDRNDGVMMLVDSPVTDFSLLIILLALSMALILDEREKRLFQIIQSTRNGAIKTILAKIGALFFSILLIHMLLFVATAVFASCTFGLGDLSRSIQSIPDLSSSLLTLRLDTFLLLLFGMKTIGVFIVGLLILLLAMTVKKVIVLPLCTIMLSGISVALTFIPVVSKFNWLKYVNLYSVMNPYPVLRSYLNLNFFGIPIHALTVLTVLSILLLCLFSFLCVNYYLKKKGLEFSDTKRRSLSPPSRRIHSGLWFFEGKKLLVNNRAALILAFFLLFQLYSVKEAQNPMNGDDYYYQHYMDILKGPLTTEKETFILAEQAKIDDIQKKLADLSRQLQTGELSPHEFIVRQQPYTDKLSGIEKFSTIYEKYLYVKSHAGAEFFFETGYERLFSISDPDFSTNSSISLLAVMILCLSSLFAAEYQTNMVKTLNASKYGIKKTVTTKLFMGMGLSCLLCILSYGADLINTVRFYGLSNITSTLVSIPALHYFGDTPIWIYCLLMYLMRFLVIFMVTILIAALSFLLKNTLYTVLTAFSIFVIPLLLHKTGLAFFGYISLAGLLSNGVFVGSQPVSVFLLQIGALLLLSLFCMFLIYRRFGKETLIPKRGRAIDRSSPGKD